MTKQDWWRSLTDEQRAELKDKPAVAKAMFENRDCKEFVDLIYIMRDVLSDVCRVRVE